MQHRNLEIERLRAVAVIMTTVAHGVFNWILPTFMVYSFTGVDLFFVISGFVVTASMLRLLPKFSSGEILSQKLAKSSIALKTFYLKRAFRIAPLAATWMAIYFFLAVIFKKIGGGGNFADPEVIAKEILGVMSGFYNFLTAYGLSGNISHYWSLAVEEQFYLVAPLLLVFFVSKKNRILLAISSIVILMIISPLISALMGGNKVFSLIYGYRYFSLFVGVLITLIYTGRKSLVTQRANEKFFIDYAYQHLIKYFRNLFLSSWFSKNMQKKLVGLFSFSLSSVFASGVKSFKFFAGFGCIMVIWTINGIAPAPIRYGFSYVVVAFFAGILVYLASLETGWILEVPVLRRVLEYIGSRSYGIYLGHFAFVRLKPTILSLYATDLPQWVTISRRGLFLQDTLLWIGLLIACEIFFWLIEQPFINMGKAYIKSKISIDNPPVSSDISTRTLTSDLTQG